MGTITLIMLFVAGFFIGRMLAERREEKRRERERDRGRLRGLEAIHRMETIMAREWASAVSKTLDRLSPPPIREVKK